jgi:hypothetical protein
MINAESIEEAEGIAQGNPYIKSIRIYEVSDHWKVAGDPDAILAFS